MKKRGMKKRILAALMTACMVVGAVPGMALADGANGTTAPEKSMTPESKKYSFNGNETTSKDPDIELSKTAEYNAEDDTYTITLSAKAKQQIKTKPTHVVFLLDASGSMNYCSDEKLDTIKVTESEKEKLSGHQHYILYKDVPFWRGKYQLEDYIGNGCTEVDAKKAESRWAIAKNAIKTMSDNLGEDVDYVWFNDKAGESQDHENPYNDVDPKGFTVLVDGVNTAKRKFNTDSPDTDKVMIIVADGDAQKKNWLGKYETYYPKNEIREFKDQKGKVYTVGFTFSSSEFSNLSSGKDYNFDAANESELKVSLSKISENIKSLINDPLGNNVELVGNVSVTGSSAVEANVANNTITWNDPDGLRDVTLTYKVRVKSEAKAAGTVKLNGEAVLNYTDGTAAKYIHFPTPYVTGAKLTVNYVDDATKNTVKTDTDWVGLTGGTVSFKGITEIPKTITVDGTTYYVISSDPETIPVPTSGEEYTVTVKVSQNNPQQEKYTVTYKSEGVPATSVTLPDMKEYPEGAVVTIAEAPEVDGYQFVEWKHEGLKGTDIENGTFKMPNHPVTLTAVYKKNAEQEKPTIPDKPVATDLISTVIVECKNAEASGHQAKAYTVSDHDSYEIGDVELVDGKYQSKIKIRGYYYAKLYNNDVDFDHAVTANDVYYTLTWDEQAGKWIAPAATDTIKVDCTGSEPAIPETPKKPVATDLPSVVVQCVNENRTHQQVSEAYPISHEFTIGDVTEKDGTFVSEVTVHSWYYADKFNAESGVKHPVTVNDVTFEMTWNKETKKWTAPAATSIKTIKVDCSGSEKPEDPELPSYDELKALIGKVVLVHTGSNAEHKDAEYDLVEGSYEITRSGNEKAVVTVNADDYVTAYNEKNGTHTVQGKSSAKLTLVSNGNSWELAEETLPVQFTVKCTGKTPEEPEKEKPDLPEYDDLKKLFGESITVTCTTDADHEDEKFGLMAGSCSVTRNNEDNNAAVVTVRSAKYIKAFNDGKHTNAGDDAARVDLIYDDGTWYAADEEIVISFKAKCEKKAPEKQFTDIKFVVVNGTFTENGKTEITKSFAVGTKLTLADIPESKGKNSGYSDQTWDKYPLGYTVGEEGTTFTITYRWKSSGSDSGSDDSDDSSVSTRKYATDASGKHGRWILEGGEFTEDNGRLPSNEYLKIGDTIYGFYTYGFAIDFDRPEYYTDEAIQAKGGYRDATGTWRLNGWWFCYDDGTFPHNEWKYLTWNGRSDWYYFDVDGWMEDGWLFQNNNWYYLHTEYDNTRGHMYTGWHEIDGKWYYFNTAADKGTLGALLTNTTTPDGFQVDANGAWIR